MAQENSNISQTDNFTEVIQSHITNKETTPNFKMTVHLIMEELQCPICCNVSENSKILNCGHTFCVECLIKVQKDSRDINCPSCRQITQVGLLLTFQS